MLSLTSEQKTAAVEKLKFLISKYPFLKYSELVKLFYNSLYEDLILCNERETVELLAIEVIKYLSYEMYSKPTDFESINPINWVMDIFSNDKSFTYDTNDILLLQKDINIRELIGLDKSKAIIRPATINLTNEIITILNDIKNTFPQNISTYNFIPIVNKNAFFKGTEVKGLEIDKGESFDVEPLFRPSSISTGKLPVNESGLNITYKEPLAYGELIEFGVRYFINSKNKNYEEAKRNLQLFTYDDSREFLRMFSWYVSQSYNAHNNIMGTNIYKAYLEYFIDDIIWIVKQIEEKYKDYYITDLSSLAADISYSFHDEDLALAEDFFHLYDKNLNSCGRIDLVAFKPDGSFVVIDISTGLYKLTDDRKKQLNIKTSILTHILKNVASLKSENIVEIVYIQKDFFGGNSQVYNSNTVIYAKPGVKEMSFVTSDLIALDDLNSLTRNFKDRFYKEYTPLQIPNLVYLEKIQKPKHETPKVQKPKFMNMLQFMAAKEAQRAKMQAQKDSTQVKGDNEKADKEDKSS